MSGLAKTVARDAFLDSLADDELRIKILERDCDSLEEAFSLAQRFEAYRAGSKTSETDHRHCRVVNSKPDAE